jgi:N-succinyldiaminopimelate aminotransferase
MDVKLPDASFYLWAGIPPELGMDDAQFAKELYIHTGVTVLPGSYLRVRPRGSTPAPTAFAWLWWPKRRMP